MNNIFFEVNRSPQSNLLKQVIQKGNYFINNEQFLTVMSSRKSSLRVDKTIDMIDFRNNNFQLSRQRKNSMGVNRVALDELHSNINITLDEKLTAKLVFVKKLQKLQKQAIKLYYDHKIEQCFQNLQKCMNWLEQRCYPGQIHTDDNYFPEHLIYVRYLQCQFKYKLKLYDQSREYYQKVVKIISKLNKNQKQKTKEYLVSLQVLNACLLYEQGRYSQSVRNIQEIQGKVQEGRYKINEKTYKLISMTRIKSLIEMHEFQLAIKLAEKLIKQCNCLTLKQKYKVHSILALALKNTGKLQNAQQIMENLIEQFRQQSQTNNNVIVNQIKCYISKSYSSYVELLEEDPIKAIFIAKKWQQQSQYSDHAASKLLHLYHRIGDYEQALIQFSQISQNYKRTSQDWICLGQIKQFYGEIQMAEHMYAKALELTRNQQRKMELQLKIMTFSSEEGRKQSMKSFQRKIKENRFRNWIVRIVQQYGEYLGTIGQQSRLQKIQKIIAINIQQHSSNQTQNELMQTGKFAYASIKKQQISKNNSVGRKSFINN